MVEVDQIKLFIRADFPHDGYWKKGIIHFSDGSAEKISIKRTKEGQVFKFPKRKITKLKIEFFEAQPENSWCAITELEVWGRESLPFKLQESWQKTLESFNYEKGMIENNQFLWLILEKKYPLQTDWLMQDIGMDLITFIKEQRADKWKHLAQQLIADLKDKDIVSDLTAELQKSSKGIRIYEQACNQRRKAFLSNLTGKFNKFIFVRRYPVVPSFFAYTEGVSDHRHEFHFTPGAQLCLLDISGDKEKVTVLLDDPNGVIRDPDVSFDGKSILFVWKKSLYEDDYHLYEMDVESLKIRQITFGKHHADFEGRYLHNDDIVF